VVAAVLKSNVPQMALGIATSRIVPASLPPPEHTSSPVVMVVAPPPSVSSNGEADAVLLDEVHTLERRGDETMSEKRIEDALDLYHTALTSAEEYATRKAASPLARFQVFTLQKKLGLLQLQNSSTAEARATYLQARKTLLLLKQQGGQWNRESAKALDEIESRLLSLPRD
jgi:hypothetical protein